MNWDGSKTIVSFIKGILTYGYNLLSIRNEWIMSICIICGIFFIIKNLRMKNKYEIKKVLGYSFKNLILIVILAYVTLKYGGSNVIGTIIKYYNSMILLGGALLVIYITEIITFYKGEIYKLNRKYYKYLYYSFSIYLYATISINRINTLNIVYIVIVRFLAEILSNKKETVFKVENIDNIDKSDCACIKKEQLFKSRQQELKHILKYINEYKYNESFAISITGQWGQGKTSMMNVLKQEIRNDNKFIISIQPMVIDNRENLAKYFFNKLEEVFNSYGIYTGKGSPLKEYLESVMNIIGTSKSIPINKILDMDNKTIEDYREKKKLLQRDIDQLIRIINSDNYGNEIIILIDDFDRVDEKVIYSVLTFVKEIADFRGCIVIFLMDYQKLKSKGITYEYLDKFINKRFDLKKINRSEILDYYSSIFLNINLESESLINQLEILKNNINMYFDDIFSATQEVIDNLEKLEKERENKLYKNAVNNDKKRETNNIIEKLKEERNSFEIYINECSNNTNNTRKVKKMLRDIQDIFKYIDLFYKNISENKLNDFYKLINCNKIIFNMMFIKNFIEKEYDVILDSNDIERYYDEIFNTKESNEKLLVSKILTMVIKEYAYIERDSIRNDKTNGFINNIFINNWTYDSLMDLETVDQKNLNMVDSDNIVIPKNCYDTFVELYNSILRKELDDGNEKTIDRFNKISKCIFNQANKGNIQFWELINLIYPNKIRPEIIFINKYFLCELKKYLLNKDVTYMEQKQKKINENTLNIAKDAVIYKKYSFITLIISLAKIQDNKYSYNSIYCNIKQYNKLDGINNFANTVLGSEFNFKNNLDIDNFKIWTKYCINYIKKNLDKYNYIDIKYLEDNVYEIIDVFSIINSIENKINETSIKEEYNNKEIYGNETCEELKIEINKFKIYTEISERSIGEGTYRYFKQILIRMAELSENEKLDDDVINVLDEIYDNLKEIYNEKLLDYMTWQYCGSKLIKIKINNNKIM